MGRVGLTAFLEAGAEEIRYARTQRWHTLAVALSALAAAMLMLIAIAASWDTAHRIATIVALAVLVSLAGAGAWWVCWRYAHVRRLQETRTAEDPLAAIGAPPPASPSPVLQREHAWLLLPAAVLALLYPRVTLRLVAGVFALWRSASAGSAPPRVE